MGQRESVKHPNIVYVFPDQFRVFAMGFMGADPVTTPHLDRFASESVVFENAVSNFPVCSPHRGMLFTGRWPHSTGVMTNCNTSHPEVHLGEDERCLPDVLSDAGYSCGYIGKYHLETPLEENAQYTEGRRRDGRIWDAYTPPGSRRHGFDFWHSYGCCDWHLKPHYWVGDAAVDERIEAGEWSVKHETDVAVRYIRNEGGERDADAPFALFVAYNPPHPPYSQVPEEYRELYEGKTAEDLLNRPNVRLEGKGKAGANAVADYFAAVSGVDEQFGRILQAIEEAGIENDTIVVFSSDHGDMMGSHGRMGKSVYYEESLRIPMVVRYPARLRPGRDELHFNVPDIMPTLLGLSGLRDRIPEQVEGTDYSTAILGESTQRPSSSFYLAGLGSPDTGARGVRTDRHTFVVSKGPAGPRVLLFDRETDPYQLTDIAPENPGLAKELLEELNRWLAETEDPWDALEWPVRAKNAFAVRRDGHVVTVDFEQGEVGPLQAMPTHACAGFTEVGEEVIAGQRSLKADTLSSDTEFHEYLRFPDLLQAGKPYEVTYDYRVLATRPNTEFYTVVRSRSDTDVKASRLYWAAEPGESGDKRFRFETGDTEDHQLIFGVKYQGAIVIDNVVITTR